ncbi:hypothetical protein [Phaeacidiphilus oryzae]|jgi:hypothetical protein|uniref:hypothetical protein n=1 Tax=Phaeacidiphilus oryzae TaxID=348818 RepID=UPI000569218C|nr:hypothetical protein [Phaeacidiphilus oryzae]
MTDLRTPAQLIELFLTDTHAWPRAEAENETRLRLARLTWRQHSYLAPATVRALTAWAHERVSTAPAMEVARAYREHHTLLTWLVNTGHLPTSQRPR